MNAPDITTTLRGLADAQPMGSGIRADLLAAAHTIDTLRKAHDATIAEASEQRRRADAAERALSEERGRIVAVPLGTPAPPICTMSLASPADAAIRYTLVPSVEERLMRYRCAALTGMTSRLSLHDVPGAAATIERAAHAMIAAERAP